MRPAGELRQVLWNGVCQSPGTTRDLAMRTGVGTDAARWTLDNMRRAGVVSVVDEVRVPGVRRPVPVYGLADAAPLRQAQPHERIDWTLVRCWAQFPTTA